MHETTAGIEAALALRDSVQLWPDSSESQARTNLRQLLHHLRAALPDADRFLKLDGPCLGLQAAAPLSLDVAEFEAALGRAKEAEERSDRGTVRTALEEAERCYRGDLLPGLYDERIEPIREELRQERAAALERLASLPTILRTCLA